MMTRETADAFRKAGVLVPEPEPLTEDERAAIASIQKMRWADPRNPFRRGK